MSQAGQCAVPWQAKLVRDRQSAALAAPEGPERRELQPPCRLLGQSDVISALMRRSLIDFGCHGAARRLARGTCQV